MIDVKLIIARQRARLLRVLRARAASGIAPTEPTDAPVEPTPEVNGHVVPDVPVTDGGTLEVLEADQPTEEIEYDPKWDRPPSGNRKRTPRQKEEDYSFIRVCLSERMTTVQIQALLNARRPYTLSTCQIQHDIEKINKRLTERHYQPRRVEIEKALTLESLDGLEKQIREALEDSKKPFKSYKTERVGAIGGKTTVVRDVEITEERLANAKYFELLLHIIDQRRAVLGLDAPIKTEVDATIRAGVDLEQLRAAYNKKTAARLGIPVDRLLAS
jgi:hypothetical protein